jgi:hypothetical protein
LSFRVISYLLALACLLLSAQAAAPDPAALVRSAIQLACTAETKADLDTMATQLSSQRYLDPPLHVGLRGWRQRFSVPGGKLTVERIAPRGLLRWVKAQYDADDGGRPVLLAIANVHCAIHTAVRLYYDVGGHPAWLEHLDGVFNSTGQYEPLNPPVPRHQDPGGIPVALVDTGVNYLLPEISARLARDQDHGLLGYDYWDLDQRPFDVHPVHSVFFPQHHGTQTASLLLAEAPVAKLLPYRYPRPDMTRMQQLVEDAAAHGVKLMNLSLASDNRHDWLPFYEVAKRHSEMLFIVAAGNKNRNIDHEPMYPAALPLDNMITVTSATADGRLAWGVNWGPRAVDLMVPAAESLVTDFDGQLRLVSGSSYATARVTALAACLLAAHPTWLAPQLKAAIFKRAIQPPQAGSVAQGFIPDPVHKDRGACKAKRPASGSYR